MKMICKLCGMIALLPYCLMINASRLERLDSIVVCKYGDKKKCELCYNGKGEVERVLYYRWDDESWSLTNRREYFYNGFGKDTLCILSHWKDGRWQIAQRRLIAYGNCGEKRQEQTFDYADDNVSARSRWDFQYNEIGKQMSASEYREKQGVWRKTMMVHNEHDADGKQVKEMFEDFNTNYPRKGNSIMYYDEEGRIAMQVDSIYEGQYGREWRRREFFYNDQGLCMVKETLTTIDHDVVQQTMDESLFDSLGNLIQTRHYRKHHGVWQHARSVSYVYDLNMEASFIRGNEILLKVLDIDIKVPIHHKLLKKFSVEVDEDEISAVTLCYYSEVMLK